MTDAVAVMGGTRIQAQEKQKRAPQGEFKCDCGAVFDFQGKLNLHKYHCANKRMKEELILTKKQHADQKEKTCKEGEHSWRVLRADRPAEQQAIERGFDEVCRKCQELQ